METRAPEPPSPALPLPVTGRRRTGFSLVEVLVAMILLITAAVGVTSYTVTASTARQLAQQRSYALIAAQEVMDSIRALGFKRTTTGTFSRNRTVAGVPLTVDVTVQLTATPTLEGVAVTVSNSRGTRLQQFFTTLYSETQ